MDELPMGPLPSGEWLIISFRSTSQPPSVSQDDAMSPISNPQLVGLGEITLGPLSPGCCLCLQLEPCSTSFHQELGH